MFRADAPYPDLDERVVLYESKMPEILSCRKCASSADERVWEIVPVAANGAFVRLREHTLLKKQKRKNINLGKTEKIKKVLPGERFARPPGRFGNGRYTNKRKWFLGGPARIAPGRYEYEKAL